MKIGVAQLQSYKGNIEKNIEKHLSYVQKAINENLDIVIFPELSITAYEPELANELGIHPNDKRFDVFQKMSNQHQIIIGIGAPTRHQNGICISLILFHPNKERQIYSKKHLHADEEPFFVAGKNEINLICNTSIALSICYELSIPAHAEAAAQSGATVYISSVAKTQKGVEAAHKRLSTIAKQYEMTVFMGNCIGFCDNFESVGQSAVWNKNGKIIHHFNNHEEGILSFSVDLKGKEKTD